MCQILLVDGSSVDLEGRGPYGWLGRTGGNLGKETPATKGGLCALSGLSSLEKHSRVAMALVCQADLLNTMGLVEVSLL